MEKPNINPDFTIENIYKTREYNSERYNIMNYKEVMEERVKNTEKLLKELESIKETEY